jgi:uncharacterized damage-inducible protein DinB
MKKAILILVISFCATQTFAQLDSLKAQLVRDWQRAKTYTQQYLNTMPADKYSFKANDSIRSFADQMLHLAQGNIGMISTGTGAQRIWVGQNLERSTTNKGKDSVSYYVNASYDYAIQSIQNMDANTLLQNVKQGQREFMRLTFISKAFEHQTHHRGQCTIYIRLLGIKPPNELLF